ncbi:DNA end-binding protein Ku [Geomicrobium halophilum]|uniref:Non-homologous end joining protein Ku n=1 Tax=Geomicrobium halophilum TaxID=549000 RepID=A0A841PW73_9BACL|nr:Ku protein [Geomicrobium halophilum]MBB6450661.1 DNA end-binding protein Ku [Geomicrobium halophilum]
MHTIWKGSIQFGLVTIPIKLHAATEDKAVSFRNLHKKCHTPIKYEKVCPVCEETVDNEEIVKGHEMNDGRYVVVDNEELKSLKQSNEDKAVEILDFIHIDEIDPIYFNRSYYLGPGDGGTKAYALLRKALADTRKVGIAKIMIRSKEQLAVLRIRDETLLMETLHYPDEIRATEDVPNVPSEENVAKKELDTAVLLIDQLTANFQPEKYEDEYRKNLMDLIESKQSGENVVTPKKEKQPDNVTNLMDALQASVDSTKKKSGSKKSATSKKKTTSKKTS